jgi:hypothetical protein
LSTVYPTGSASDVIYPPAASTPIANYLASATNQSTGASSLAITVNPAAGNFIVVLAATFAGASGYTVSNVSDSLGTSFKRLRQVVFNNGSNYNDLEVWVGRATSAGSDTVTITFSATITVFAIVALYSNAVSVAVTENDTIDYPYTTGTTINPTVSLTKTIKSKYGAFIYALFYGGNYSSGASPPTITISSPATLRGQASLAAGSSYVEKLVLADKLQCDKDTNVTITGTVSGDSTSTTPAWEVIGLELISG